METRMGLATSPGAAAWLAGAIIATAAAWPVNAVADAGPLGQRPWAATSFLSPCDLAEHARRSTCMDLVAPATPDGARRDPAERSRDAPKSKARSLGPERKPDREPPSSLLKRRPPPVGE